MSLTHVRGRIAVAAVAVVTAASLAPMQGSAAAPRAKAADTVDVTGTVLVLHGEDDRDRYSLQLPSGTTVALAEGFEADPLSTFAGTLEVPGTSGGTALTGSLRTRALARATSTGTPMKVVASSTAPGAPAPAVTSHTTYVAKVTNFGTAFSLTDAQALTAIGQAQQWWIGQAGGTISSWTTATGVVPVTAGAGSAAGGCGLGNGGADFDAIAANVGATAFPGVDFSGKSPNHLVILIPDGCGSPTAGRGRLGTSFASGGPVILQADAPALFRSVLQHEYGHNVSLQHSNNPQAEYGGLYEVMGADDGTTASPVLGTVYRWEQGILTAGEVADGSAGGSWNLSPRTSGSGLRGVAFINPDNGRRTFVDYRDGSGLDAGACYTTGSCNYGTSYGQSYVPGIVVESENQSSGSLLLTGGDGSLQSGETYTSGRLTVRATSASGVQVSFAPSSGSVSGGSATLSSAVALRPATATGVGFAPAPAGYRYQWNLNGTPISGAEDSTYTPTTAMVGGALTVTVTAYAAGLDPAARTSAPQTVQPAAWYATGTQRFPIISGSTRVGGTLTATGLNWVNYYSEKPADYSATYRWTRNGQVIQGATASTYRLTSKDKGKTIQVSEFPRAAGYDTAAFARSSSTSKIRIGKLASPRPKISGKAKVGKTVKVKTKGWTNGTKFKYQWFVGKKAIKGAAKKKLKLTRGMKGKKIQVKVTGKKSGYKSASSKSKATKVT